MRGVFQEGPQGRQPRVAATHGVLAIFLQMIEKGQNQLRVEVRHRDRGWDLTDRRFDKTQEEPEGIPIGGDGAGTDGSMLCQMLDEKSLKQSWKGRCRNRISHGRLAQRRPRSLRIAGQRPPGDRECR
jgi:hypothetical protein